MSTYDDYFGDDQDRNPNRSSTNNRVSGWYWLFIVSLLLLMIVLTFKTVTDPFKGFNYERDDEADKARMEENIERFNESWERMKDSYRWKPPLIGLAHPKDVLP